MILLLTLQEGLGYSPVKAGAVTLGFAAALAIGSARSAAATKRLGTRVLVVGCALMIAGQLFLKRGIGGTYVGVEPFHLFRYLDEQTFRYNNRKLANDGERFEAAMSQIAGRRLTFNQLTGK